MSLKSTGELSVMAMNNYAKFQEEPTCHAKVDMSTILTRALESLKNFHFNGFLLSKVYIV